MQLPSLRECYSLKDLLVPSFGREQTEAQREEVIGSRSQGDLRPEQEQEPELVPRLGICTSTPVTLAGVFGIETDRKVGAVPEAGWLARWF